MNFVTVGDEDYSTPIKWSVSQMARHYPNSQMYIYDWGLSQTTKRLFIANKNVNLINWRSEMEYSITNMEQIRLTAEEHLKSNKYTNFLLNRVIGYEYPELNRKNEYLYSQKPYCIRDCANRINRDLVFLDGDAILINDIDELKDKNFDIGVTLRPQDEIKAAREKGNFHVLNAGVIYFLCESEKITAFVNEWIQRMSKLDCDLCEQTALTKLIQDAGSEIYSNYYNTGILTLDDMEIKVMILPTERYNYYKIEEGVNLEENRILHFKNNRFEDYDIHKFE